ncbi:membrane-bound inhibitor of C-type lysozyme/heat shock protein HslJ [Sinorhizobium terangae]|uniref:META domain-containing protein n=1 Tax=Sinorhizobium terangae TaxID=110322 RepID=A0A6N7LJ13_SINTE|nr:META domain-containing protein [Sinorhizobium terangae]MBB4186968.1 membrane-bound inhibitor of C-type lysozyme/heat shock protein HslJ [Sinorhizobium terangae]MQX16734.1 META domain-containing protein [Sinorhizobium terangae]
MLKALTAASCACVLIELASTEIVAAEKVPEELVGSWLVEDIGGGGVIEDLHSVLEIREDGTYGGMAGCNNFTGAVSPLGTTITFGPTAAARKMCAPAIMDQEQKFFDTLRDGLTWRIDGGRLTLTKPDGAPVMRLASMEAAAAGIAEITLSIPDAGAVDRQKVRYDCGCETVEAEYINAGPVSLVTFSIRGTYIVASAVISGSGARYAGGRYIWWTEGEEATLFDVAKGEDDPGIACRKTG